VALLATSGLILLSVRIGLSFRIVRDARVLERAQHVAGLGYWQTDADFGGQVWSPPVYGLFGLDPGAALDPTEALRRVVDPRDRQLVRDARARALTSGTFDVIYRIVRP